MGKLLSVLMMSMVVLGSSAVSRHAAAAAPKKDVVQSELKMLQGLWQTSPGGMYHRDGRQVVANPVLNGPCFFIRENRLIWLDEVGKPTGREEVITLDVKSNPKRITLTPVAGDKEEGTRYGIYSVTESYLTIHLGLDGKPAPRQFLELNKPIKGVDGREWLVSRKKLGG